MSRLERCRRAVQFSECFDHLLDRSLSKFWHRIMTLFDMYDFDSSSYIDADCEKEWRNI
jgi:hypothetical protein